MAFDSVVWKNSYLCGDGDKSVATYSKRYAYLVVENVGNFQNEQGWHSGSHAMAWAAITTSAHWVFLRPSTKTWHSSTTLLHFIILNMPKTIDNIRSFLRMTALWFSIALCGKIRIFAVTGIIRRYIFEALCLSCSLKT